MQRFKSILFTTTAAIAIGASVSAYANGGAYFQPPAPQAPVAAAAEPGHWFLTLGGLYMRPTDSAMSNSAFAQSEPYQNSSSQATQTTNLGQVYKLKPKFHWGGYAELGYQLPNSPYDVMLGFNGNFGSDKSSAIAPSNTGLIVPFFSNENFNPNGVTLTHANAKLQTDYFAVDLVGRRHFNLGHGIDITPYAGARFTYLSEKYTLNASGQMLKAPVNYTFNGNAEWKTKFWGAGPHIGTTATFPIVDGLHIFGDVHASLLMGTTDNKSSIIASTVATTSGQASSTSTIESYYPGDRNTRFVPATGGKVGLGYTAGLGNGTSLGLQAGWGGDFYYHAIDNRAFGEDVSKFSNFTIAGPFAGIKISG